MGLIQAIVYGIVQGLTEFLPISSSGHLFLLPDLMGWKDAGAGFTAVIQLGTILAVLIYFREDIGKACRGFVQGLGDKSKRAAPEFRLGAAVLIGTIPVAVIGLLLEKKIDHDFRSAYIIAGTLIVFGLLLWVAEKAGAQNRNMDTVSWKDGLIIGFWQCLALVPGSSRSGSTITGSLFRGLEREAAARFSFLLSIPAILLSGLYKLFKDRHELLSDGATSTLVATLVSFVVGYWAIGFLMKYLKTRSTLVFVVYRVVLGLVILALVFSGRLTNKPATADSVGFHHHGISQTARPA